VSYFDDGVFAVTPALVDKGTSSIPSTLTNLLNLFNVGNVKTGNNYDHLFRYIIVGDMGKKIF